MTRKRTTYRVVEEPTPGNVTPFPGSDPSDGEYDFTTDADYPGFSWDTLSTLAAGERALDLEDLSEGDIAELFHLEPVAGEEVKNVHKTPPKGKPTNRSAYADPQNYKWPIDQKHIRAAVSYYNHGNRSGYDSGKWATIGRRIASAANRLIGSGHSASGGKINTPSNKPARAAAEPFDEQALIMQLTHMQLIPADRAQIVTEEVEVNGEPCFRYQSMVIPGDAISRNVIPGKSGPTYYSAKRVRQYVDDNNRLLEEMRSHGEKVTVFPRHAAAVLEAALPLGWVDRYFTRPSDRPGVAEDAWYEATIPLSSDGRDLRTKLRTNLVQFSSLRTDTPPALETRPAKVNGRAVEEAVRLPIIGIDLVATRPGLPVRAIQLLEEAATVEYPAALEDSMSGAGGVGAPPNAAAQQQQQQQQAQAPNDVNGQQPQAQQVNVPEQYTKCPSCGSDIGFHIAAAHSAMTQRQQQQQQGQSGQPQQQQQHQNVPPSSAGTEEVTRRAEAAEAQVAALRAELEAKSHMASNEELEARLAAIEAKQVAVEAENAALKGELAALEEVKTYQKQQIMREAVATKVRELCTGDASMGNHMAHVLEENPEYAGKLAALESADAAVTLYWQLRAAETDTYMRSGRYRKAAGFGHVAVEEHTPATSAAGTAGVSTAQPTGTQRKYSAAQQEVRSMFARTGGARS